MTRYNVKRILIFDKIEISCMKCKKTFKSVRGFNSHYTQMHGIEYKDNSNRGKPVGTDSWNKGLTKNTDIRVKKSGQTYSDGIKSGRIKHSFTGKSLSLEHKIKISKKLSKNNKGGRCKWYKVDGISVQGTWERDIAIKMSEFNIDWSRSPTSFGYVNDDGAFKRYTPDFYLKKFNLFLEIKGYWWGNDKRKMELIFEQYPNINILIMEKEKFENFCSYNKGT